MGARSKEGSFVRTAEEEQRQKINKNMKLVGGNGGGQENGHGERGPPRGVALTTGQPTLFLIC